MEEIVMRHAKRAEQEREKKTMNERDEKMIKTKEQDRKMSKLRGSRHTEKIEKGEIKRETGKEKKK